MRLPDRLALGGATLTQVDGEDRHGSDGQELALPVLQRARPEVRPGDSDNLQDTLSSTRSVFYDIDRRVLMFGVTRSGE